MISVEDFPGNREVLFVWEEMNGTKRIILWEGKGQADK
jgi:hypothetical protein